MACYSFERSEDVDGPLSVFTARVDVVLDDANSVIYTDDAAQAQLFREVHGLVEREVVEECSEPQVEIPQPAEAAPEAPAAEAQVEEPAPPTETVDELEPEVSY